MSLRGQSISLSVRRIAFPGARIGFSAGKQASFGIVPPPVRGVASAIPPDATISVNTGPDSPDDVSRREHTGHVRPAHRHARRPRAAFERVRENRGCRGADGMTVGGFAADLDTRARAPAGPPDPRLLSALSAAPVRSPETGTAASATSPFPPCATGSPRPRPTSSPGELFEAQFEDVQPRLPAGAVGAHGGRQIDALRSQGFRWVVDADIDGFFDTIPHDRLLGASRCCRSTRACTRLFERWISGRGLRRRAPLPPHPAAFRRARSSRRCSPTSSSTSSTRGSPRRPDGGALRRRLPRPLQDRRHAAEALELTDDLLEGLGLDLNREKTRSPRSTRASSSWAPSSSTTPSSCRLPPAQGAPAAQLPPPLDLWTYLELRAASLSRVATLYLTEQSVDPPQDERPPDRREGRRQFCWRSPASSSTRCSSSATCRSRPRRWSRCSTTASSSPSSR